MPFDVFFAIASSGVSLIASMFWLVHPPKLRLGDDGPEQTFCLPPVRHAHRPPPLPQTPECSVSLTSTETLTLRATGDEWEVTLDSAPMADVPAMRADGTGMVNDLRWNQRAGLPRAIRRVWKQKPARA